MEFGSAWDNDILLTEIVKTLSEKDTFAGRIAKILSNSEKYTEINSIYRFLEKIIWVSPNSIEPDILPEFYDNSSLNTILGALDTDRSEEHTSELQSLIDLVCRLLLEKKNRILA